MKLSHLSVSTIESFAMCPRSAYLKKTLDAPKQAESAATAVGRAVHKALELYYAESNEGGKESLLDIFDRVILDYHISDFSRFTDARAFLAQYEKEQSMKPWPMVISTEREFTTWVGGFPMLGYIDRIDYCGDGRYEIRDYKTSFTRKEMYEIRTDVQLTTYAMALKEMWNEGLFPGLPEPTEIYCALVYLRHGEFGDVFTDEQIDSVKHYIEYWGNRIDMIDEEPLPCINQYCRYCDYRGNCQVFSEDYEQYLGHEYSDETDALVARLKDLRKINKATRGEIDAIQEALIGIMDVEQVRSMETQAGDVKIKANRIMSYNLDRVRENLPEWYKYAKIDYKLIEKNGTDAEKEMLKKYQVEYETSPFIQISRGRH